MNLVSDKLLSIVLILLAIAAYKLSLPDEASGAILGAGLLAYQHTPKGSSPYQP